MVSATRLFPVADSTEVLLESEELVQVFLILESVVITEVLGLKV